MTKTISILGSTGSIGRQTLEVAEQLGLTVAAITAHNSVQLAEEQARKFQPRQVIMTDESAAKDLKVRLADTKTRVHGGTAALSTAATLPGVGYGVYRRGGHGGPQAHPGRHPGGEAHCPGQ